ncbi:MAG: PTS system mannose/fructose/sorbose family transporter subunit IID [Gemmatimonadales bacterium]
MTGLLRTVGRLLVLQGSWTYERMQGLGFGYASLPLLRPLAGDPERYRAAVARATEYFNAHPYLSGIAVGAAARAENDGVPGAATQRLKTALAGPLGALGDRLFWIGVVPAFMGAAALGTVLGAGLAAPLVAVLGYLAVRLVVTWWGVRLGYQAGTGVAAALKTSGLGTTAERAGLAAGLLVGAAIPLAARWLLEPGGVAPLALLGLGAVGGAAAGLFRGRLPSARVVTLGGMVLAVLWYWSRA